MSRTMVYRRREAYVVVLHTQEPPTDAEWEAYVRDVERWQHEVVGYLIITDGGAPTGSQRRRLRDQFKHMQVTGVRTSVVSGSLMIRGIVNALGLFNAKIQAFRPDAIDAALAHISAALHAEDLLAEIEVMRERLR